MKKGSVNNYVIFGGLALLLLISLFIVYSAQTVSADSVAPSVASSVAVSSNNDFLGLFSFNFTEKLDLWRLGSEGLKDTTKKGQIADMMKYYILILMIILIYSILAAINFPEKPSLRFLLAIITGFMATFLISSNELLTLAQSYGALGLAITTFFPIFILGAFTIVTATSLNPVGIFLSKILWLGYALFLFFRTGLIWLASRTIYLSGSPGNYTLSGTISPTLATFFGTKQVVVNATTGKMGTALSTDGANKLATALQSFDPSTLFILGVVAIAVLYFMVIRSNWLYEFIDKMKREGEVSAAKGIIKRSGDYDKIRAEEQEAIGKK